MNDKIHIVLASDANYRPGLAVTKASILRSCSAPERIVWHVFDERALDGLKGLEAFASYHTSKMPYLRLFLPDLMPDVEWIVYADVDTVWQRDVCELWDFVFSRGRAMPEGRAMPAIFWVRDFEVTARKVLPWLRKAGCDDFDESRYACTGVCVMNLGKMRKDRLGERAVELVLKAGSPPFADQDILNLLYHFDSALLPDCWDVAGHWQNRRDWDHAVGADGKAVYHIFGVGRHFHDRTPVDYPSTYDFWNRAAGRRPWNAPMRRRYRLMAACWWASGLVRFLPGKDLRCRVYRQWLFAKVIGGMSV